VAKARVKGNRVNIVRNHLPMGRGRAKLRDRLIQEALAGEMIYECMAALRTYGIGKARLVEMAKDAAARRVCKSNTARVVLGAAQQLADMIAKWGEDQALLDASGRPAVLSLKGRQSEFACLAKEFFPGYAVSEVLQFGCEAKAMEMVGRDKVARLNDWVVFTGNSLLILAYSVRSVRHYLATANFNRKSHLAVIHGRPDRTSTGEIPVKDVAEFMNVMRPQISDIVEMSNRWLANRSQQSKRTRCRKKVAGIQAFLFCD
jgi:hypothetical protein